MQMNKKVVIVGGGSAGWMTATTLVKLFPTMHVTLVESPNIPIAGVGESTIAGINEWMKLVGIEDKDFMKETDATYKLSIKFNNFYKQNDGGFHYPFAYPDTEGCVYGTNDWHYKKLKYPNTPNSDYANCFSSAMALVNENKFDKNTDNKLPSYRYGIDTAYHFDATKFGLWLRDNICLPGGVEHITEEVNNVLYEKGKGVKGLELGSNLVVQGDLYIDCTGFRSLLLDKTLKEPFESFAHMLPNNRAWATRMPYTDKRKQMEPFTDCTAYNNGWVWNIPLWSRIGTGYVYSDKHISPEQSLNEFKMYLSAKHDVDVDALEYRDIKMRIGMHDRIWVENVCAIGLSAGFIEPLESNGLYTVHMFLVALARTLLRSEDKQNHVASRFDIDSFNMITNKMFKDFAGFVAMHYALTQRTDNQYWLDNFNRSYEYDLLDENNPFIHELKLYGVDRMKHMNLTGNGWPDIATGMGYNPIDRISEKIVPTMYELKDHHYDKIIKHLDDRKARWKEIVKHCPTMYDYLNTTIFKDVDNDN